MGARDRLVSLDALRAIAALMVVIHHGGPSLLGYMLVPRAYLAVDFFFMLSGFVMSRAYEDRLRNGLCVSAMMRTRIARLYPTVAIGIFAAAAVRFAMGADLLSLQILLVTHLLFIPVWADPENSIFFLNGVQWSLLFELLANFIHARVYRLTAVKLAALIGLAAVALVAASWIFGSLAIGDRGSNVAGGFARVAFPYLTGMLLHRAYCAGALPASGLATSCCAVTLCGILMLPDSLFWWTDAAVVIVVFPLLLAATVTSSASERFFKLAELGGRLSYPLYAVHLAAIAAVGLLLQAVGIAKGWGALTLGCGAALLLAAATNTLLRQRPQDLSLRPARP